MAESGHRKEQELLGHRIETEPAAASYAIPYIADPVREHAIYEEELATEQLPPHTTELCSIYAVSTRLESPETKSRYETVTGMLQEHEHARRGTPKNARSGFAALATEMPDTEPFIITQDWDNSLSTAEVIDVMEQYTFDTAEEALEELAGQVGHETYQDTYETLQERSQTFIWNDIRWSLGQGVLPVDDTWLDDCDRGTYQRALEQVGYASDDAAKALDLVL